MDGHLAAFLFGFASCAFISAGVGYSAWLRIQTWITTPSEDVSIYESGEDQYAVVNLRGVP